MGPMIKKNSSWRNVVNGARVFPSNVPSTCFFGAADTDPWCRSMPRTTRIFQVSTRCSMPLPRVATSVYSIHPPSFPVRSPTRVNSIRTFTCVCVFMNLGRPKIQFVSPSTSFTRDAVDRSWSRPSSIPKHSQPTCIAFQQGTTPYNVRVVHWTLNFTLRSPFTHHATGGRILSRSSACSSAGVASYPRGMKRRPHTSLSFDHGHAGGRWTFDDYHGWFGDC